MVSYKCVQILMAICGVIYLLFMRTVLYKCINNCGMVCVSGFVSLKIMLIFLCKTMCQFYVHVCLECYSKLFLLLCVRLCYKTCQKLECLLPKKSEIFLKLCVQQPFNEYCDAHFMERSKIHNFYILCLCGDFQTSNLERFLHKTF